MINKDAATAITHGDPGRDCISVKISNLQANQACPARSAVLPFFFFIFSGFPLKKSMLEIDSASYSLRGKRGTVTQPQQKFNINPHKKRKGKKLIQYSPQKEDFNVDRDLPSSYPGSSNQGSTTDSLRPQHFYSQSFPTQVDSQFNNLKEKDKHSKPISSHDWATCS
jgi:hypothetical protein